MDWEWPMDTMDKKDKIKLIRYMRQLKIATGDKNIRRRIVRSPESTTMLMETTTTTTTRDETTINLDDSPVNDSETTTEWSPQRELDENDEITTEAGSTTSGPDFDETTQNWRARGYKRKRIKGARKTTTDAPEATKPTEVPDYEERNSLEDVLFGDEENFIESDEKRNFFIALRLSPFPEQLVKGYEFKMLNKFVDVYTLNSHNLTQKFQNSTFHHSRLMGVSDIYNSDALIDVIVGLGAPIDRIILNTPAFGNSFNLMSKDKNLPGSATTGLPQTVTYQQVCQILTKGNWTLERDEDLTGPYSYLGTKWVAFDDDTSLKIKAKYVLLRDMAGIGLMSIDADDVDNVCGKGKHSLLNTIGSVVSNLQRKPRQLIVTSLEQDLLATAQNFIPVTAAQGLRVSPFRIVRIVDREGEIQSIRENSETVLECSRQGYYRHPEDCSRFYRCVKFNQYENDYTIFEYGCPDGLVFDDRWEVCVWPSQATPCDGSSEIFPIPKNDYVCPGEGFFVDPENCRWFFACRDHLGDGTYTHYEFRCPFGLAFDEANLRCEWPWLVSACDNDGGYSVASQLPTRKDFANNYNPGGNNSPFPSVPSIPNFESSRTAVPRGGKSHLPIPEFTNLPPRGQVVKDSCENCFSNVLTITGKGHDNGNGIEVAGPLGAGSNFRNTFRKPKAKQFSTTAIPAYSPSSTLRPDYSPSTPITTAGPTKPTYQQPASSGTQADNGYNYPVPLNPLEFPSTTLKPYKPSSTSRPAYRPTTSQTSYNPSTTEHSNFISPEGPSLPDPAPSQGYNYPAPQIGISVSNPGEAGLIPSYNVGSPVTPNLPAYGVSSTYPTTPASVSSTYGAPVSTSYAPAVSTGYAPVVSTGYAPAISSTYAPPVSSTYQPAYNPPTPAPSYAAPHPSKEPSEDYGVPAAPVVSTTSYEPAQSYGVPSGPVISTTYGPIDAPSESYGTPLAPVNDAPAETYGVPLGEPIAAIADESFGIALSQGYDEPSDSYNKPAFTSFSTTFKPVEYEEPSKSYGAPSAPVISSTYKPIVQQTDPYKEPSNSYGVPSAPVVSTTYAPSYNEPSQAPSQSYGVPLAPVVSSTYAPIVNEVPLPNYGKPAPQSNYDAGRPASLPASWPNYPSSSNDNYSPVPPPAKELPTPPEIRYGGFKPPSIPEPVRLGPVYQQPTYSSYPSRPTVDYGGFKGIPGRPVDSYNNAKPAYNPISPNIPAYGPTTIKPKPSSGYSYPVPANPLNLPTNRKPVYKPTPAPVFVSTTPVYASTRKPYTPSPVNLPVYGSTTAQPPTPPQYYVSSTHPPAHKPTKLPSYNPSTPAPFVDFGSDAKKESEGYSYPVPSNPLEYPQRTGRTGPNNKAEVGSVIPVGFSSATLSNGPFSSISSASDTIRDEQRQQKSFVAFGNDNAPGDPGLGGNSKDGISSSFGGNKSPNPRRPVQGGSSNDRNAKKISGFNENGQNQPTLKPFISFGGDAKPQGDSQGSQSASTANFASRPGDGRQAGDSFGRQPGGREENRGGRQGLQADLRGNAIDDRLPGRPFGGANGNLGGGRGNSGRTGARPGAGAGRGGPGFGGRPASNIFGGSAGNAGRPGVGGPGGNRGNLGRPASTGFGGNNGLSGRPGANGFGGNNRRPAGQRGNGVSGRPGAGANRVNPGSGFIDFGGNGRRPGSQGGLSGNSERPRAGGFGGNRGEANRNTGRPGNGGGLGRPGAGGLGGNQGNGGRLGAGGNRGRPGAGGNLGRPGTGGFRGNNGGPGAGGVGGARGAGGRPGFGGAGGANGRPGAGGSNGRPGFGGNSGLPGNGGFGGGNSLGGFGLGDLDDDARRGKELGGFGGGVTSVKRPVQARPAVLGKLAGNNWNSGTWEKFGPGGYRSFNETLGPEVCQRPGLFRHPADCTKFYECYWDKWIEKFTLHIFPCPVAMAVRQYDESISACNWPFLGPNCEGNTIIN